MMKRRAFGVFGSLLLLGSVASTHAGGNPSHATVLTFSGAVSLPGVTLEKGPYLFQVANPDSSANVVTVQSPDRTHVYFMGFTQAIERPSGPRKPIELGEAAPGRPAPVKVWYPDDTSTGHEFLYR